MYSPVRFLMDVFILNIFTSAPSCLSSLVSASFFSCCLSIFLHPKKTLVYCCFLVFRSIGEYISLDLFYFVSLTSSCSLITRCTYCLLNLSKWAEPPGQIVAANSININRSQFYAVFGE